MKSFYDINFKNKTVILRVDINSPVVGKKVILSERIIEASKTIKELKDREAKIIVLAHQGRKGDKDFISLKQHAKLLNKFTKISFVADICGKNAIEKIKKLKSKEAILLENIRYLDEELKEDAEYVKILSKYADIYINDAFSVSHRAQASIVGFPKFLKSYFGPSMKRELDALKKITSKKALLILGGSKTEENCSLISKKNKIIVGGRFGQLYMFSKGFDFGKNNEYLDKENLKLIREKSKEVQIIHPIDFAVKQGKKRKEISIDKFPNHYEVFDIGKKSIELFKNEIKKSKFIFMKGPLGYCEEKQFRKGTLEILKEIAKSKSFSVLGGGHLSTLIKDSRINKNKFGYISLSGGALVSYIAKKELPG
ncbi:MAG: phosphoglycerate kinase, partial [Candidatus Pacearchaeota archaeon]